MQLLFWIYFLIFLFKFPSSYSQKDEIRWKRQYNFSYLYHCIFQDLEVKKKVRLMISSSKTCVSSIWLKFSSPPASGETTKKVREKDEGCIGQARSLLQSHTRRTNLQIHGSSPDFVDQSDRGSNKSRSKMNLWVGISSCCHPFRVKILLDIQ